MSIAHDERRSVGKRKAEAKHINVGDDERLLSKIAGGTLVLLGLEQRSFSGLLLAAMGGAMLYRGISGDCQVYRALGIDTSENERPFSAEDELTSTT